MILMDRQNTRQVTEMRHIPAGSFVLFEDVDGKGHGSLHSLEAQTVLWNRLPEGLENP